MASPAVRRTAVELAQAAHRLGLIRDSRGVYRRQPGATLEAFGRAQARAVAHELETLGELVGRLEQLTAPPVLAPTLPADGTVARAILDRLAADRRGKDHDHVRMLTGLTDAELATRVITRAGANSLRPRRLELVRRGLVEAVPGTSPTRWTLTEAGLEALRHV